MMRNFIYDLERNNRTDAIMEYIYIFIAICIYAVFYFERENQSRIL